MTYSDQIRYGNSGDEEMWGKCLQGRRSSLPWPKSSVTLLLTWLAICLRATADILVITEKCNDVYFDLFTATTQIARSSFELLAKFYWLFCYYF